MSRLSNTIMVACLEDGSQITANILVANGSLSQAWDGEHAIPDFRNTVSAQPLLYISVVNNGSSEAITVQGQWYWNNQPVSEFPTKFTVTTYSPNSGVNAGKTFPALRIIDNLASVDNTDVDTFSYVGTFVREGSSIGFEATALFNITRIQKGSFFGQVTPALAYLTSQNDSVTFEAHLYDANGPVDADQFQTTWQIDADGTQPQDDNYPGQNTHKFTISGSQVEDYASIICRFWQNNKTDLKWTALCAVDDTDDRFSLSITSVQGAASNIDSYSNYGEGRDAKLRKSEAVKFKVCVIDKNDPSVNATDNQSVDIHHMYIRVFDFQSDVCTAHLEYLSEALYGTSAAQWRELAYSTEGDSHGYYIAKLHYNDIKSVLGGSCSGTIIATTDALPLYTPPTSNP